MKLKVIDNIYKDFVLNIEKYFSEKNKILQDKRNKIIQIDYNNKKYVIKSFKIPHIINKIAYTFFRDSKAKKSFNNSLTISNFTPKPIGYIEFKKFGLINKSFYICEEFDYDFTIRELLFDDNFNNKKDILKEFASFTNQLHKKGIYHLDYSPGNILIKKIDKNFEIKVVDVNRMKFIDFDIETRAKNFAKIWLKDNDLEYIIKEYTKLNDINYNEIIDIALDYSRKHKEKKNFKKRLKGMIKNVKR
jgi:serine/threonine protein kinase